MRALRGAHQADRRRLRHRPSRRHHGRRLPVAALFATALLGASGVATALAASRPAGTRGTSSPVPAVVHFAPNGHRIPQGFFGLSIEYNELPQYERSGVLFDRFIGLVRPRDGAPMSLRVGGKSADHAIWQSPPKGKSTSSATKLPHAQGVFGIGETWLENLASLVHRDDLRVTLDLNLAVHSPALETSFAKAANAALPKGSLAGLEIGNEPDMYHFQPPLGRQRVSSTERSIRTDWMDDYSPADYRRDYISYAKALKAALPNVGLVGPEITNTNPAWLGSLRGLGDLGPAYLTVHRYASSTCWSKSSPYYPSIPLLLSDHVSAGLAGSVEGAVRQAHAQGVGLRLDEVNSVSCGGNEHVADSFATALWTPDVLFQMIDAGVGGISWHIRPGTLNAPFHFIRGGIAPYPELYGLALFAEMTHGPASLYHASVSSATPLDLDAWAVRRGGSEDVLLINKGGRTASVAVPALSGHPTGQVQRLLAPRVRATNGVTLGGQSIGADAEWQGAAEQTPVRDVGGAYYVLVPRYSAALIVL